MHILAVNIFTGDIPLHSPECPLAYMNLFKHPILPPPPTQKKKVKKKEKTYMDSKSFPLGPCFQAIVSLKFH